MIVRPAIVDGDRTRWHVIAEPDDLDVPRSELWIDGALRPKSAGIEAIWLVLVLGPFARHRLVVPCAVSAGLCLKLGALSGVAVAGPEVASEEMGIGGAYTAALTGDSLDVFLGTLSRTPANFSIASGVEPPGLQPKFSELRVVSNGPTLRRSHWPLDRIGEVAALMMVAPAFSIRGITAFLCREECGGIAPDALADITKDLGLTLEMPLAHTNVHNLGKIAKALAIPDVSAFSSCWTRYRMFPSIIGRIYRDLEEGLDAAGYDTAERRIAEYLMRTACGDGEDAGDAVDEGLRRAFYCVD